jgi:multiple sugar transport system substrate-binding protein
MAQLSRRSFLAAAGAAGLGTLAAACGGTGGGPAASGGGGGGSNGSIQMTWWGSPERHKRTQEALKKYESLHDGVKIRAQFSGWDGYWEKLATQTAGGQPPDLIQMDYAYITEYAGRGALLPLDEYVPDKLAVDDWADTAVSGGKVGGKLYGMNTGINSMAMMYNAELLKELGLEMPDYTMSWDDFIALGQQVKAKAPDGLYATQNGLFESVPFEPWLRQRGKNIYAGGKLGYEPADLTEWFTMWLDLQKAGVAASAEEQATAVGDVQNSLMVRRKSAFHFGHSNQLTAFAGLSKFEVGLHMYPGGDKKGQYY